MNAEDYTACGNITVDTNSCLSTTTSLLDEKVTELDIKIDARDKRLHKKIDKKTDRLNNKIDDNAKVVKQWMQLTNTRRAENERRIDHLDDRIDRLGKRIDNLDEQLTRVLKGSRFILIIMSALFSVQTMLLFIEILGR